MSLTASGFSGPIDIASDRHITIALWWGGELTGSRQEGVIAALREIAGPEDAPVDSESRGQDLQARAMALAAEQPYVAVSPHARPVITGNLAEDVHAVSGLTWKELAEIYGITERAVASWRTQGVPRHRQRLMQALRTIGAMLVGGLGPDGVKEWLSAGQPSRLDLLRAEEFEPVVRDALAYGEIPRP